MYYNNRTKWNNHTAEKKIFKKINAQYEVVTPQGQISSAESFDSLGAQGWNKRTVCNLIKGHDFFGEK